jgi:hypothetical protein
MDPNLSQALHLLNGQTIQRELGQSKVIADLMKEKKSPNQIIEELYIRSFGRTPTTEELAAIDSQLPADDVKNKAQETRKVLDDVFWALLNSEEFMFNH